MMSIVHWSLSRAKSNSFLRARQHGERLIRIPLFVDQERTNILRSILHGDSDRKAIETPVESESIQNQEQAFESTDENCAGYDDQSRRLEALENCEELRMIYSHPQWQEFLGVLYRARATPQNQIDPASLDVQIRSWCHNHPQISQMLAWFQHCTARYGLSFDPFETLPVSRLLAAGMATTESAVPEPSAMVADGSVGAGEHASQGPEEPESEEHVSPQDTTQDSGSHNPALTITWEQQQYAHAYQQQAYHVHYCLQGAGAEAYPQYPQYPVYGYGYAAHSYHYGQAHN